MSISADQPPIGGAEEEFSETLESDFITRESIITQINQIYNTISNNYSFRIIRQYCRGIRPNALLQSLIKLVSSLQEGLKHYQSDLEELPYFKPIDDFLSFIKFDVKIQNIMLFCTRMEQGVSILISNAESIKKSSSPALQVNNCYISLLNACNELGVNDLTIEKINNAITAFNEFHESVNNFILIVSTAPTLSPTRSKQTIKNQAEKEPQPNLLTAKEILDVQSKMNSFFHLPASTYKDQHWTKQAQSYTENLEKNLHQLLYIFALKSEFENLSSSLHTFQNIIDKTGNFPEDNQKSKRKRRKKKKKENENQTESTIEKVENENQSESPFQKKPPETNEIEKIASYAKWAEVNQSDIASTLAESSSNQTVEKKKRKKRSSSKSKRNRSSSNTDDIDEDFEDIANILPAKSISQRHMRPYDTISDLEMENRKLEELIRQCPHQPEEVKQLRDENGELSQKVRELVQELDELESLLRDEEDKLYESE